MPKQGPLSMVDARTELRPCTLRQKEVQVGQGYGALASLVRDSRCESMTADKALLQSGERHLVGVEVDGHDRSTRSAVHALSRFQNVVDRQQVVVVPGVEVEIVDLLRYRGRVDRERLDLRVGDRGVGPEVEVRAGVAGGPQ